MSEETVLELYKDMDENKAAGLDNVSGKFLKDTAAALAKPISQICNVSTKYSIFLTDYKILKLKLLLEKGSKTDPPPPLQKKQSHSTSLFPLIIKLYDRGIHDQKQTFLDKNYYYYYLKILFKLQN